MLGSKKIPINVKNKLCYVNFNDDRTHMNKTSELKMIYYVTPTYPRPEQMPELTRLAHTLMHVPRIHWIVADDQQLCSDTVVSLLRWVEMTHYIFYKITPQFYSWENRKFVVQFNSYLNVLCVLVYLFHLMVEQIEFYYSDILLSVVLEKVSRPFSLFRHLIAEQKMSNPANLRVLFSQY